MIDVAQSLNAIRMIDRIYAGARGEYVAYQQHVATWYPTIGFDSYERLLRGDVVGGTVMFRDGNGMNVFLAGCLDRNQAKELAFGYTNNGELTQAGRFNWTVYKNARLIWDNFVRERVGGSTKISLFGHSSGGVAAEAIAKMARTIYPNINIHLETFGCPCPAEEGRPVAGAGVVRRRWMRDGDVVPLLPFAPYSTGRFVALYSQGAGWQTDAGEPFEPQRFRQPPPGIRMGARTIFAGELPNVGSGVVQKIAGFLAGDQAAMADHAAIEYYVNLNSIERNFPNGIPETGDARETPRPEMDVVRANIPPASRPAAPLREMVPVVIDARNVAFDVVGRAIGNIVLEKRPMSFLQINPKKAFRMVRVGRQWQVSIGQRVVMVADAPKRPKTITKRLNSMLRAIGTDNTVWLAEFIAGLQDWLIQAASDDSYCRPTARVDM